MGHPVSHSLSPTIHRLFAEQTRRTVTYDAIPVEPSSFEHDVRLFFQRGGLGLNITLPFKERAFLLCEAASERATQAGASNTLWLHQGQLRCDNTDGVGLLRDLTRFMAVKGKVILLVGAGGAARGVLGPLLAEKPRRLMVANRSVEKARALQKLFAGIDSCALDAITGHYDVVINATSMSVYGEPLVLPFAAMVTKPFCYDLAYVRTGDTPFVASARAEGCMATDGLGMLIEQAAESFFIWHGIRPETSSVRQQLQEGLLEK